MKNKKKLLLIIIPIIVILIVSIVLLALYMTTDLFKSNETLFWKYFSKTKEIENIFYNDNLDKQNEFKSNNSYTSSGTMSLKIEKGEDSLKQLNIETNARHDKNTNRTYADAILKNGDIDLFNISYINSGDIYAIKCDEVFQNYVGFENIELSNIASNYGIENFPNTINLKQFINSLKMTDEELQHISEIYLPLIMENIPKERYIKQEQNLQINEQAYNTEMYSVEISSEELRQIIIRCLSKLKTDTQTLISISNKCSNLGLGIEYTDTADLSIKIDEIINKVQNNDIINNLSIVLNVFENNVLRAEIKMDSVFNIIFENTENLDTLSIDISQDITKLNRISTNEIIDENSSNEIIDLNQAEVTEETEKQNMTRIILTKGKNDNLVNNNIKFIPNANKEEYIELDINMSDIQNDYANNSYMLTINTTVDNTETVTLSYDTETSRVDQVEEILELTGNNTALVNNYDSQIFNIFMQNWINIFNSKLKEKLSILGFNIL